MNPCKFFTTFLIALGASLIVLGAWAPGTLADPFPTRPIKIVVPWQSGSGPDVMNRVLAEMAKEDFGVPVVVTNMPGGSGSKGTAFVARQPADGYTLINAWVAPHAVVPLYNPDVGYDPIEDYSPIAGMNVLPFTLVVPGDHPADSLQEFVAWADRQDRQLKFGACGALTVPRMVMEEFVRIAEIDAKAVPYPGCMPENVKSVIDGSTDFAVGVLNAIKVFGDRIKTLAVFTSERVPLAPDIPTAREQGYEIGWGRVGMGWGGLAVRGEVPEHHKRKLIEVFGKHIASERFRKKGADIKFVIEHLTPGEFGELWERSLRVLKPSVERILREREKAAQLGSDDVSPQG